MVDCASNAVWGNFGCDGGFIDYAFAYTGVYPLMEEKDYPYRMKDEVCKFEPSLGRVQTQDFWMVPKNNKEQLKAALNMGPVGVNVAAST